MADDYRMQHRPDTEGAPLHDIEQAMPDYHSHPEWYRTGERFDHESHSIIRAARNAPESKVTIYRAVPHGVKSINPGDWVSLSRSYAKQHGMHESDPRQDWPVLSMSVPAKHLRTPGDSIHEWGYFPE